MTDWHFLISLIVDFFSVRLLSVQRRHSVFSSPSQRPMTSDFEGFSIPDYIHYIFIPILIIQKEPLFPFLMLSAKQGNYWYHFYNVFSMTRSLTGDWTRDLPHSKPAISLVKDTYPLHTCITPPFTFVYHIRTNHTHNTYSTFIFTVHIWKVTRNACNNIYP